MVRPSLDTSINCNSVDVSSGVKVTESLGIDHVPSKFGDGKSFNFAEYAQGLVFATRHVCMLTAPGLSAQNTEKPYNVNALTVTRSFT